MTQPNNKAAALTEREQFEAWAHENKIDITRTEGAYDFQRANLVWGAWQASRAALPAQAEPVWNTMQTAPRDGTMLRLLVQFDDHATEDSIEPCPTIGANSFDHTEIDQWQFAGWDWQQDCFTEGKGTPVGWLPLLVAPVPQAAAPIDKSVIKRIAVQTGFNLKEETPQGPDLKPYVYDFANALIRAAQPAAQNEPQTTKDKP